MNTVKRITAYLAHELNLDSSQSDVLYYGLHSLTFTLIGLVAALSMALPFGLFREALVVVLVIMVYRKASGGAHASSPQGCLLIGSTAILVVAQAARYAGPLLATDFVALFLPPVVALGVAIRLVPVDVPQKPITSPQQRRALRTLTFSLLGLWLAVGMYLYTGKRTDALYFYFAGNMGVLWQTFLLTEAGGRFIAKLDGFLTKFMVK